MTLEKVEKSEAMAMGREWFISWESGAGGRDDIN